MRRTPTITLAFALGCALGCASSDVSRTVGARCDRTDECDERCLTAQGTDWPGGFCTVSCDDDGACPGDSRCVDGDGGVCLFECRADPDCAFLGAGWGCVAVPGRPDGEVMVCRGR